MNTKILKIEVHEDDRNVITIELDDGAYEQFMTEHSIDDLRYAIEEFFIGNEIMIANAPGSPYKTEEDVTKEIQAMSLIEYIMSTGSCRGCKQPAAEPHSCPWKGDIKGDYETQCNCCERCTHECSQDI